MVCSSGRFGARVLALHGAEQLASGVRAIVRERLCSMARRDRGAIASLCREASDNVATITGFTLDRTACPDPDAERDEGANLFACATIPIHTDDGLGRFSYLLCLGVLDGSQEGEHVLRVLLASPPYDRVQAWDRAASFGRTGMPPWTEIRLRQGMMVMLENNCPHWMTAVDGDSEIGEVWTARPDREPRGVRLRTGEIRNRYPALQRSPRRLTALFAAYGSDRMLSPEQIHGAFSGIRLREPELARAA